MLDKIKEYVYEKKYIIIGIVLLVAIYIAYDVFSGSNVSNNGIGINRIQSELNSATDRSQSITTGLGELEQQTINSSNTAHELTDEIGKSRDTVTTVIEGNKSIKNRILTIDELITRNQQINDRVRSRGKVQN